MAKLRATSFGTKSGSLELGKKHKASSKLSPSRILKAKNIFAPLILVTLLMLALAFAIQRLIPHTEHGRFATLQSRYHSIAIIFPFTATDLDRLFDSLRKWEAVGAPCLNKYLRTSIFFLQNVENPPKTDREGLYQGGDEGCAFSDIRRLEFYGLLLAGIFMRGLKQANLRYPAPTRSSTATFPSGSPRRALPVDTS